MDITGFDLTMIALNTGLALGWLLLLRRVKDCRVLSLMVSLAMPLLQARILLSIRHDMIQIAAIHMVIGGIIGFGAYGLLAGMQRKRRLRTQ